MGSCLVAKRGLTPGLLRMLHPEGLTVSNLFNEIAAQYPYVEVNRKSVHRILKEKLGMKKVCARWVPHELTDENCKKRMGSVLAFLMRYEAEGNDYLDRIVTGDETWVHYWTTETKKKINDMENKGRTKPKKIQRGSVCAEDYGNILLGSEGHHYGGIPTRCDRSQHWKKIHSEC